MSGRSPQSTTDSPLLLARARLVASRYLARLFLELRPASQFLLGFVFVTAVTTLLLARNYSSVLSENYREGDVVRANIVAPADITVIDERETERQREMAMNALRPVWNFDEARRATAVNNFRNAWRGLQQRQTEARRRSSTGSSSSTAQALPLARSGAGDEPIAEAISADRFDSNVLERLTRLLSRINDNYIYDDAEAAHIKPEIRFVDVRNGIQSVVVTDQPRVMSLRAARAKLRASLAEELSSWSPAEQEAVASAMLPLVTPTLVFDEAATSAARSVAAGSVAPIAITLKRYQVVAREGDTVTAEMLRRFAAIRNYSRTERRWPTLFGLFLLTGALYWAAWKFIEHRSETSNGFTLSKQKAFMLVGSAIVIETVLMRVGFTFAESVTQHFLPSTLNDPLVWTFAIPFASAALLVALLADAQLALITGLTTALFAGYLAPTGILASFYAMVSSAAAIYGIERYRERQSVTLAGLFVGVVNALTAVAVMLAAQQPFKITTMILAVGCGVAGGLLTTIFTAGGLPINESVFGILTDVKLLELSNVDTPILSQLALRAPGTNQHSHAVSQLAEDACRAIGANALLARIGALYHDIGKLAAPDMFVENQGSDNPHDRLRPASSARVIISHVPYGLQLAKDVNLPKQLADFIPQHHGTRKLHFFLRKAEAQASPGEGINEADFRYPGPKPQSKEAAVMMLCDSCEAATRSLNHPDPENIRTLATKIFDAVVSDDQLDECDLTLRELNIIRESIITSLIGIHHARIDYPGFNPPPKLTPTLSNPPALPPFELQAPALNGVHYEQAAEVPISPGGEVEDEALAGRSNRS